MRQIKPLDRAVVIGRRLSGGAWCAVARLEIYSACPYNGGGAVCRYKAKCRLKRFRRHFSA
ncbi:TPA: hypothetical protein WM812_000291 [Neisseria gonorrhoeae]